MAFDERQAERLRACLKSENVVERKMMGGLALMVDGHMCCGLDDGGLMVRVGPDAYERALKAKGARPFDITGRPLRGMVRVDLDAVGDGKSLAAWVGKGLAFVRTLPPK